MTIITLGPVKAEQSDTTQWDEHCLRILGRVVRIGTQSDYGERLLPAEWAALGYETAARELRRTP